ncbi:UNVERIFIED_CONTAM: hypothetical protein Slati_0489200 [Sesamum latifolium]|uniref:Uncharacterized protein n=1 Tax=Sesamum latifolium TaxID=2727402 RepID=A0AAW2XX89_9LAMI
MKTPSNAPNKQKTGEAPAATTQALQVVPSVPLTPLSGTTTTAAPRSTDPAAKAPRITTTHDALPVEMWSPLSKLIQTWCYLGLMRTKDLPNNSMPGRRRSPSLVSPIRVSPKGIVGCPAPGDGSTR